jgi:FtsZ-binding cell division protein ZapB
MLHKQSILSFLGFLAIGLFAPTLRAEEMVVRLYSFSGCPPNSRIFLKIGNAVVRCEENGRVADRPWNEPGMAAWLQRNFPGATFFVYTKEEVDANAIANRTLLQADVDRMEAEIRQRLAAEFARRIQDLETANAALQQQISTLQRQVAALQSR